MKYQWKRAAALGVSVMMLTTVLTACFSKAAIEPQDAADGNLLSHVITDKARYNPGDTINYTLTLNQGSQEGELVVRYKHLDRVIEEKELERDGTEEVNWSWTPPADDYQGYMTEIFFKDGSDVLDHANIAVDVSSDWGKFPRYGYLADFMAMEESERQAVVDRLNRFRINGVQFYDWQWKHHIPLKLENGQPAASWPEIANREVSFDTVKGYIDLLHKHNMKAMNYNLIFGAFEDAEVDGVKKEWGIFRDPLRQNQDRHPLPDSWASDIMMYDPSNAKWRDYLIASEKEVFEHLPFDGWHVDQLGDRGSLWNYEGKSVNLAQTYGPFLQEAKKAIDVDYVMNAVGQFAQAFIATTAPVKFLYTEVWDGHPTYRDLKGIIDQNLKFSKGELSTVIAGYLNYNHAESTGEFNAPGVLLTKAVIFASGGSQIALGENMLAKEYFPNKNLSIPAELEQQMIVYYDFLTAYQNVLRDQVQETELEVTSADVELSAQADKGKVWTIAKQKEGMDMIHLINFSDAVHMNWNDTDANQAEPTLKENIQLQVQTGKKVEKVWMATPDFYNGSAIELEFKQADGAVELILPKLKYWDMVVIEYTQD
ncbi:glycoside hydrolase family 66 protein [Paenibacillus abyssi]|uniref:Cycloisomaltooligosaccharide glucanotransferase n=1 Tax=Paenibacillus abyssi TaxID=1340531 RepID=A0A917FSF6_9BACL|nr:glycoside hydrolase family 66 protein [Paenibacillus abyssi]GGG04186.1 cycloisomaltooligosaccharide glucanotransferase [Paenibacillus abyssi]